MENDRAVNWRSRSFNVINFCCNRKPVYDLLLVINRHLSSISHRFREIQHREVEKHQTLLWGPRSRGLPSSFVVILGRQKFKALGYILVQTLEALLQYTRVTDDRRTNTRQTTYHDNSRTLQWNCNVRLKRLQLEFCCTLVTYVNVNRKFMEHIIAAPLMCQWDRKKIHAVSETAEKSSRVSEIVRTVRPTMDRLAAA